MHAQPWMGPLSRGDDPAVWACLDEGFRAALVQQWLHDTPQVLHDGAGCAAADLEDALSCARPTHELSAACCEAGVQLVREAVGTLLHAQDALPDERVQATASIITTLVDRPWDPAPDTDPGPDAERDTEPVPGSGAAPPQPLP